MKQIVDKLNNIAKAIDENVELPTTDLIIDSLDAITRAYGGTPSESNLIVDKLEDIEEVAHGGITPTGNIAITENTVEPLDIAQYATATVNVPVPEPEKHYVIPENTYTSIVQGGLSGVYIPNSYFFAPEIVFNIDGVERILKGARGYAPGIGVSVVFAEENETTAFIQIIPSYNGMSGAFITTSDTEPTEHTISAYYVGDKKSWQILSVKNSQTPFAQYETYWNENQLYSNVIQLDNGQYSYPILVYPFALTTYCCYSYGAASSIVCSTVSSPANGYYTTPSDENNLAFITWADNVS